MVVKLRCTLTVEEMPQGATHRLLGSLESPPVKLPRNAGGRSGARRLAKEVVPPALRQRLAGPQYSYVQWHDWNTWPYNLLYRQYNELENLFYVLNERFDGRGHTWGRTKGKLTYRASKKNSGLSSLFQRLKLLYLWTYTHILSCDGMIIGFGL